MSIMRRALLRDSLGATHAAVLPAGITPSPRGGAVSSVSGALTGTAIRDRRSLFYDSTMDLTVVHPGLAEDLEQLGWQAAVCAPLPEAAGAVLLAWDEPQTFSVFDRAVVASLGLYIGQALDRSVQHDARAAITETLQQAMLSPLPDVDDYELAAFYRAATSQRVGGDWYDVIPGPYDRLALVIGDVVGHDTAAAARMGQLRTMLRAYLVDRREPPSALLRRLDAANHALGEATLATAVVAFIDRAPGGGHRLRWSNAGHPPPVVIHPDGEVRPLTGHDMLLGARRGSPRHTYTAPLPPGSTVLLHTDGLVENRAHTIDEGFATLYRRLGRRTYGLPRDLLTRLSTEIAGDRSDDIAMLAVRVPGRLQRRGPARGKVGSMQQKQSPKVLGLVVHPRNDVSQSVATVVELAGPHGLQVVARPGDAARLGEGVEPVPDDEFADRVDFVFSLGGDGTMLGAMRLVAGRPTPVLGVNHGTIGFLIEVSPAELPGALDKLIAGEFSLEPHSCLELAGQAEPALAFNDVVLTATTPWTAVSLDLEIDDVRHGYFKSDAVVVCTPTGSTAYNYAAGGPIMSPSAPLIGITPVAPMSGITRPIVLGGNELVSLRAPAHDTRISLDGASTVTVEAGTEMVLRMRPGAANVVRFDRKIHGARTRVKLSLLDLPLRPDQLIELVPEHLRDRARFLEG